MADAPPYDFDVMLAARGLAQKGSVKQLLLRAGVWGSSNYVIPAAVPVVTPQGQWTASTVYTLGMITPNGNSVFIVLKAGTSAASGGPTGKSNQIADGTVIWSYLGYLAPVAYTFNQALFLDQIVCNGGKQYQVTTAGTTASSGSGPVGAGGTDGTVVFAYIGEQTLPIITAPGAATSGLTAQVAWNSPNVTALGGTFTQLGANSRGSLFSTSAAGAPYAAGSGGGGSWYTVTDAPSFDFGVFNSGGSRTSISVWANGQYAALVVSQAVGSSYINADSSGLKQPRLMRTFRYEVDSGPQFFGIYATAADSFSPYTPAINVRWVHIGDSFVEGVATGTPFVLSYAVRMGHLLGIEDYRVSGLGGTGILKTNGGFVSYTTRYTQDVISQAPNGVTLQMTQNDVDTPANIGTALAALLARNAAELPGSISQVIGVWNNRTPLSSNTAGNPYLFNEQGKTVAAAANAGFVDWSSYLTDGGFVGTPSGTGNSYFYTASDGVHPTPAAHEFRSKKVAVSTSANFQKIAFVP